MAYGEGLSTGAIGSLTRLMARPTQAERLQIANNNAAAERQASSQQHQSATRERDYQQQARERNLARNARASEVMDSQQEARYMMERGNELAMERQRETNAFRLQSAMSRRTTSGKPGGTMRPDGVTGPRPEAQGGGTLTERGFKGPLPEEVYTTGPNGITNQAGESVRGTTVTGFRNTPEVMPEPMSVTDQKKIHDMGISTSKTIAAYKEEQSRIFAFDYTNKDMLDETQAAQAKEQAMRQYSWLQSEINRLEGQNTLMGVNGSEAASNAVRHVTTFGGVAEDHMDEAMAETDGSELAVRNYLRAKFGYEIR